MPEVRGRASELDADLHLAGLTRTKKYNAALLILLSSGVGQDEFLAIPDVKSEHYQSAVGVDHEGLSLFLDSLISRATPSNNNWYLHKDALAAAAVGHGLVGG